LEWVIVWLDESAVSGGAVMAPQYHDVGPEFGSFDRSQCVWLCPMTAADQRPFSLQYLA